MMTEPVRITSQKFTIRQPRTAAKAPGPDRPPAVRAAATASARAPQSAAQLSRASL